MLEVNSNQVHKSKKNRWTCEVNLCVGDVWTCQEGHLPHPRGAMSLQMECSLLDEEKAWKEFVKDKKKAFMDTEGKYKEDYFKDQANMKLSTETSNSSKEEVKETLKP